MKAIARVLGVLVLVSGPVLAEEKPLSFEFSDAMLGEAVQVIARAAGVEIAVEKDLAGTPVTLTAKDLSLESTLGLLAKLAGSDVEWRKEAEGRYVIARKVPEWKAALLAKLDGTRLNLDFEDMPVEDAARFIAEFCGAAVVLDPAWLGETEADERNLTLKVEEASLRDSLDLLTVLSGLAWEARWGVVFIATKERLAGLPASLLTAPAPDLSEADGTLRRRLAAPVTLSFEEANISEILTFLHEATEVDFLLPDKAVEKCAKETPVSLHLAKVTVEQALGALLLPRGFQATVKEGKLVLSHP